MLPSSGKRKVVGAACYNPREDVVRIENRSLSNCLESLSTQAHNVCIGSDKNSNVAMESSDLSDRIWNIIIVKILLSIKSNQRNRKVALELLRHAHGTCARATTSVRSRESLVKIQVDNVEAHVARSDLSEQRIEVGSVVIEQPTGLVYDLCNFENVLLEDSQRVRIRDHQSSRVRTR